MYPDKEERSMALFDQKSKNIATYQKAIEDRKISIKRYFDEIGRLYYGQYKDVSIDVAKDINARCDSVTKLTEEIEDLKLQILYERGLKQCPNCKTENSLEYAFCFKCGSKFDESALPLAMQKKPVTPETAAVAEPAVVETVVVGGNEVISPEPVAEPAPAEEPAAEAPAEATAEAEAPAAE